MTLTESQRELLAVIRDIENASELDRLVNRINWRDRQVLSADIREQAAKIKALNKIKR